MNKITIAYMAVPDLMQHLFSRKQSGLGYAILESGGTALDAVEAAVNSLKDNPLFNAGKGSALNEHAEVEMDASIMNGANLQCGAVAIMRQDGSPATKQ